MSTEEAFAEAEINPDGSTSGGPDVGPDGSSGDEGIPEGAGMPAGPEGMDPAVYVVGAFALLLALCGLIYFLRRKRRRDLGFDDADDLFSSLDGKEFNLNLPDEVEEYYEVKGECEDAGWEPGQGNANASPEGPGRRLAQALMKRCIADVPLLQFMQRESPGMNRLYAQSMCSVKQWRSFQTAESLVTAEVDEVRAEADEIEPGWSQVIWRQAFQYHTMLKNRQEAERKAMAQMAERKKLEEDKVAAIKNKADSERKRIDDAEKAAQELIQMEEREKSSKSSFSGKDNGIKKGFLNSKKK